MAWLRNKSARVFNVGGTLIVPTMTTEIGDEFLENERIKEIIANGELEIADGPDNPSDPVTTSSVPEADAKTVEEVPKETTPKP